MPDIQDRDDDRERVEIKPEDVGVLNLGKMMEGDYYQIVADNEARKIDAAARVNTAYAIWIEAASQLHIRGDADEVFVIHWEDADVVIPWPEGMTVKEAIMAWAQE